MQEKKFERRGKSGICTYLYVSFITSVNKKRSKLS